MTSSLSNLIQLYQFPAGRAAYACKAVYRVADQQGETAIAQAAAETVEAAGVALTRRREFYATRSAERRRANREAVAIDIQLDRTIGALHDGLGTAVRTLDTTDPHHAQAVEAQHRAFPQGAAAITSLSYEEEQEAVGEVLRLIQGELAPTFDALGLTLYVERAAALHAQFVEALQQRPQAATSYGDVRGAEQRLQQALLTTVARIIGRHPTASAEDAAGRARLLGPILLQNDRIGDGYRRHRPVNDIDPESGEEQAPEADPSPTAPPA